MATEDQPVDDKAAATGQQGGDGKADGYKPPETQADLDRIIGERVSRAKAPYSDYAELQRKAKDHDAAVEKSKGEHEKALDAARGEGKSEATKAANSRLIRAEIRAVAAELGFRDPLDAGRYVDDLATIKVSDEGDVDAAEVKRRLEEISKTKSYLLRGEEKPGKPKPDNGQGPRPGSQTAGVSAGRAMFDQSRNRKSNSTKE